MGDVIAIECDQGDCMHNEDGECKASMVAIISQECMTYEYEGGYEGEDE